VFGIKRFPDWILDGSKTKKIWKPNKKVSWVKISYHLLVYENLKIWFIEGNVVIRKADNISKYLKNYLIGKTRKSLRNHSVFREEFVQLAYCHTFWGRETWVLCIKIFAELKRRVLKNRKRTNLTIYHPIRIGHTVELLVNKLSIYHTQGTPLVMNNCRTRIRRC
jgi:hypothetical protein